MNRRIKIIVSSKDKDAILAEYTGQTPSEEEVELNIVLPDTVDAYKKLFTDPRIKIISWEAVEEPAEELLIGSLRRKDLRDMKTVIGILSTVRDTLEFYSTEVIGGSKKVEEAIKNGIDNSSYPAGEPSLSEETIRELLKSMSFGKKVFGEKLAASLKEVCLRVIGRIESVSLEEFSQEVLRKTS